MRNISALELYKIYISDINTNIKIIDVRSPLEYALGHIKGSFNIPYDVLINKCLLYLNDSFTYYIICKRGKQSCEACNKLSKHYNIINVLDGIDNWPGKLEKNREFN